MAEVDALVIGASGLVGGRLMARLSRGGEAAVGTFANHARPGLSRLDITDQAAVSACIGALRPRTIYLAAALTHVDYCEAHPEEAARQNVAGPRHVAEAARRSGGKLVFYSTEYVFDGTAGPYDEAAAPRPLSVYGRGKLEAERLLREILEDVLILRTTVVFGWQRHSRNFAMQIHERVRQGAVMTIPDDQISSPTLAADLADTSVGLVRAGARGIVNAVGADVVRRTDFARRLVRLFGGDPGLVAPVTTASLAQKAPRPLCCGLTVHKVGALLGRQPASLEESLERLRREWSRDLEDGSSDGERPD